MAYLHEFYYRCLHFVNQLSPQQWAVALIILLIVGTMCLRGFGSRSNY